MVGDFTSLAIDSDDNLYVSYADLTSDEVKFLFAASQTVDPTAAIGDLIDSVNALDLKTGQARGLTNPLDNALLSLEKDHPDAACSQVQDFVAKVEAKTPTPILPDDASDLVRDANAILDALDCAY